MSSEELTIDIGILPSTDEYKVRVFLDRKEPHFMTWKPTYGRVIEVSYKEQNVPDLLKSIIDSIPER